MTESPSRSKIVERGVWQYPKMSGGHRFKEYGYCDKRGKGVWGCKVPSQKSRPGLSVVGDKKPLAAVTIHFSFASSELTSSAREKIQNVLPLLQGRKILVTGFTDNVGRSETNQIMASDRSVVVKNYLVKLGIDKDLIVARAKSHCCYIAANDSEKSRQINRRVEIAFLEMNESGAGGSRSAYY